MLIVLNFWIVTLVFNLLSKYCFDTFKNHYVIFNTWWTILITLSFLNFSDLYRPSIETYFIFLIGLISFNFSLFFKKKKFNKTSVISQDYILNEKLAILFFAISLFFQFEYLVKGVVLLSRNTIALAHIKASLGSYFDDSPLELLKIYYFCQPFLVATVLITCFNFLFQEKVKWSIVILTFINVLSFSIAFGGRIQFFRTIFFIFLFIIFSSLVKTKTPVFKKRFGKAVTICLFLIGIMILFTQSRAWRNSVNWYETLGNYFLGSFVLFDLFLTNDAISNLSGDKLLGRGTLGCIIDPFLLFFTKLTPELGITTDNLAQNIINYKSEIFYEIGDGNKMNAFLTMYYVFLRDFGLLGIVIIPFFLGLTLNELYRFTMKKKSAILFIIYIFSCYNLLFGVIRWELLYFLPLGTIMFLFFLNKSAYRRNILYK